MVAAAQKATTDRFTKGEVPSGQGEFKRIKAVTLPTFKLAIGEAYNILFQTAFTVGKKVKGEKNDKGEDKEPPMVANVVNMNTGELGQLIGNAALFGELNDSYPNKGYVGKGFEITKMPPKEGRRAMRFQIFEIEVPKTIQANLGA